MSENLDVSRETQANLEKFKALILRWNRTINLIGRSTETDLVNRHIRESLALWSIAERSGRWLDLGSGGGFPGIPLAVVHHSMMEMTLIDSDVRKCEFLRATRRDLDISIEIITDRIEDVPKRESDVIVSRALAPLTNLLSHMFHHGRGDCIGVFPKGRTWRRDVIVARASWTFDLQTYPAMFDPEAAILRVANVRPV